MFEKLRKLLKNQRGLTLVELLAVVVILGIISAIAVPSIGGLINNSKKDAHIGNAQTMVNAVKLMATAEELTFSDDKATVTLGTLVTDNYLDKIKDPSGNGYDEKNTVVTVVKKSDNTYDYSVKLISTNDVPYLDGDPFTIKRNNVKLKK
ncbi:type II secretion system protein [Lederbergia citri]|uniref:Prepilin-type N-terminal cleavage/methylation domain-containing protein n=1 Tax=Lederbergia citri TaxID=2833580 RepID=A0A942TEQ6_9BACI|nr:prepilin-type N-terminal cleavage/methylation domain-containing protein [Lederbergia citri]MBS4194834.1 prepilin-type N-terminal cleavage/methylation domain-containing protein [Lederbergia citri]